jgi:hypothetical protein
MGHSTESDVHRNSQSLRFSLRMQFPVSSSASASYHHSAPHAPHPEQIHGIRRAQHQLQQYGYQPHNGIYHRAKFQHLATPQATSRAQGHDIQLHPLSQKDHGTLSQRDARMYALSGHMLADPHRRLQELLEGEHLRHRCVVLGA